MNAVIQWRLRVLTIKTAQKVPSDVFIKSLVEEKIMFLANLGSKPCIYHPTQHGVMHVHTTSINFQQHEAWSKWFQIFPTKSQLHQNFKHRPGMSSTYRVRSTLSFGSFTTTALSLAGCGEMPCMACVVILTFPPSCFVKCLDLKPSNELII